MSAALSLWSPQPQAFGSFLSVTILSVVNIIEATDAAFWSALQNAASVASMILTTESIVTDKKEPKACGCGDHNDSAADMGGMY